MIRIAQISDLHFGREIQPLVDALLDELRQLQPTLIAVCGDLTQSALRSEFVAARAFLDQLPSPALVVPGNHDLPGWRFWDRFTRPWRLWRQHIGELHTTVSFSAPGLAAVGLNTARQWGAYADWSRGRINLRQVTEAHRTLVAAEPSQLRVLVAHHPLLVTAAAEKRRTVGRGAMALDALRHQVDLALGGHVHLGYSGVAAGLVVAQSGTAFSGRLKGEPNGYNVIEADFAAAQPTLEVKCLRWDGSAFAVYETRSYGRVGSEWRAR